MNAQRIKTDDDFEREAVQMVVRGLTALAVMVVAVIAQTSGLLGRILWEVV